VAARWSGSTTSTTPVDDLGAGSMTSTPGRQPRITVLTTGRQDWGILRSVCVGLRDEDLVELDLVVGGMHLSSRHGRTVDLVRADGFTPTAELDWLSASDDPPADAQAGAATTAVGQHLRRVGSDGLVLVGDRFETAAAAIAATVDRLPIAHLHGGEQTYGAFDDALRHAISKLSHLHLVASEEAAAVVRALGEDPTTIHVIGAPGVDAAFRMDLPDRDELEASLGLPLTPPVVVVTVHPTTLDADPTAAVTAVIAAMDAVPATYVITLPNVDPGGDRIRERLMQAASAPGRIAVDALGERRYWGLLRRADAMLGNSSSGLIEAPAVRLPVVDVGDRQAGRRRGANVIHADIDVDEVTTALRQALDPAFRAGLPPPDGPLTDGRAGARAAHIIGRWRPPRPPRKAPIRPA
jgi:UDP-hydrolysing UDP-N-acetyl-D-glucosamine 2-epimerase